MKPHVSESSSFVSMCHLPISRRSVLLSPGSNSRSPKLSASVVSSAVCFLQDAEVQELREVVQVLEEEVTSLRCALSPPVLLRRKKMQQIGRSWQQRHCRQVAQPMFQHLFWNCCSGPVDGCHSQTLQSRPLFHDP